MPHRIFLMGSKPWRSLKTGGARHGTSRCWTGGCSLENWASSPSTTGCGPETSACLSRWRRRGLPWQSGSFAASSILSWPSTGAVVWFGMRWLRGLKENLRCVGLSPRELFLLESGSALACWIMPLDAACSDMHCLMTERLPSSYYSNLLASSTSVNLDTK